MNPNPAINIPTESKASGMNDGLQKAVGWSAKVVQSTQTGVSQSYLFVFGAGLLFVVLILLI